MPKKDRDDDPSSFSVINTMANWRQCPKTTGNKFVYRSNCFGEASCEIPNYSGSGFGIEIPFAISLHVLLVLVNPRPV